MPDKGIIECPPKYLASVNKLANIYIKSLIFSHFRGCCRRWKDIMLYVNQIFCSKKLDIDRQYHLPEIIVNYGSYWEPE